MTTYNLPEVPGASGAGPTTPPSANPWGNTGFGGAAAASSVNAPPVPAQSGPGAYSVNPLDPVGTAETSVTESANFLDGLKNAIFGTSAPDSEGQHGGILGDTPIVGMLGRTASEAISNAGQAVVSIPGHAADAIGGALEHIPVPSSGDLQAAYDALDPKDPIKMQAEKDIKADPSIAGHIMSKAVRDNQDEVAYAKPDLYAGMFTPPGSVADTITNLFDGLGFLQRGTERLIAGAGRPGSGGMNQLDMIKAVGSGQMAWTAGAHTGREATTLSPVEQVAYDNTKNGTWTDSQALDFIASHNAGISHDVLTETLGKNVDPLIIASLGAGAIAAFGKAGAAAIEVDRAMTTMTQAEDALNAAKTAAGITAEVTAPTGIAEVDAAQTAYNTAMTAAKEATKVFSSAISDDKTAALVGRYVQGNDSAPASMIKTIFGAPYAAIQDNALGQTARVARNIIDPMQALSGASGVAGHQIGNLLHGPMQLDVLTQSGVKAIVSSYGFMNHLKVLYALNEVSPDLLSEVTDSFGTYSSNLIRRVVATAHRRDILASARLGATKAELFPQKADEIEGLVDGLRAHTTRNTLTDLANESNRMRIRAWDDVARANLADRMVQVLDHGAALTKEEWVAKFAKMNPDQLSILHAATYGRADELVQAAKGVAKSAGEHFGAEGGPNQLDRIVLVNRRTLTDVGAKGILQRIAEAGGDTDAALAEIRASQKLYPELSKIRINPNSPEESVAAFVKDLTGREKSFPHQIVDDEAKDLPAGLQDVRNRVGATDTGKGVYTLGFAPEDEYRWGIDRTNASAGMLDTVGDVSLDHVTNNGELTYNPSHALQYNLIGQPILGTAGKALDAIEAMGKTLTTGVSASLINEAARMKFIAQASGHWGITPQESADVWKALQDAVPAAGLTINPRGFTPGQIWDAAKIAIPDDIVRKVGVSQARRDILNLVLDAYNGDTRFIGLTQKFTGRVKQMFGPITGNAPAVIAETLYPTVKFRLNPIFQAQEAVEGWVLNAQRGVQGAIRSGMSAADREMNGLLENLVNHDIVRAADVDTFENNAISMVGRDMQDIAANPSTRVGKAVQLAQSLSDVKGIKRLNMLRTMQDGMGAELKTILDRSMPGLWDDLKATASITGGHILTDDEYAVRYLADRWMGNDVLIKRLEGVAQRYAPEDVRAAIVPGQWAAPSHMGQLQNLGISDVAHLLGVSMSKEGRPVADEASLRAALASGSVTMDQVKSALRDYGADKDYIARFENALNFQHEGFWDTVQKTYNMSDQMRSATEEWFAQMAAGRGMTPVEYLSQIVSPNLTSGAGKTLEGHLGALTGTLSGAKVQRSAQAALDAGKIKKLADYVPVPSDFIAESDLARLGGAKEAAQKALDRGDILKLEDYKAGPQDFIDQMAQVFSAHMDPSAKWAMLKEFYPDLQKAVDSGKLVLDRSTITQLWDEKGANSDWGRQIMGDMDATEGDVWNATRPRTEEELRASMPQPPQKIVHAGKTALVQPDTFGPGFHAAPQDVKDMIVDTVSRLHTQMPDVPVMHVDIRPVTDFDPGGVSAAGITIGTRGDTGAIIFDPKYFGAGWKEKWAKNAKIEGQSRQYRQFQNEIGLAQDRESRLGTAFSSGDTPQHTITHEYAHLVDQYMRKNAMYAGKVARSAAGAKRFKAYTDWMNKVFDGSFAQHTLSEYANKNVDEAAAELLSLALDPHPDFSKFVGSEARPAATTAGQVAETGAALDPKELEVFLKRVETEAAGKIDTDYFIKQIRNAQKLGDQQAIDDAVMELDYDLRNYTDLNSASALQSPRAFTDTMTVEEAVTKVKQLMTDAGVFKEAPKPSVNPDIVRANQMFAEFTKRAMVTGMLDGNALPEGIKSVLNRFKMIDTSAAVPYNQTEALIQTEFANALKAKWQDAYRLQYFAPNRTMLERSVNHPMFGLYPASYMWGKLLPETAKFIAREPFGVKTGAMMYQGLAMQKSIAMQRSFDPAFDKHINDLGHSQMMWFLGYLLPTLPWDVSAAFPAWMRDISQQGLTNEAKVAAGGTGSPINLVQAGQKATALMDPMRPIKQLGSVVSEVTKKPVAPTGATITPTTSGPTAATGLAPTLEEQLAALQKTLLH